MTDEAADALIAIAERKTRRGAFDEAASVLTAALELAPDSEEAWLRLAQIHRLQDRLNAAIGCYRRGLQEAPGHVELIAGLAATLSDAGRFTEASATLSMLADAAPDDPDVQVVYALALHRGGETERAIEVLDRAIDVAPDAPILRLSRSTMLLTLGRYADGWPDFDTRHAADPVFQPPDLPMWDGSPAADKRLLVVPEGGYGDIVWAARFLPAVKSQVANVHLSLPPALRTLLRDVDGIDGLANGEDSAAFDCYCPILSLPVRLNATDPAAFPPARLTAMPPPDDRLPALMARAEDRLRLGIIWSGNEAYSENRHRAAPLEAFLPLIERPEVQLYSLQKGPQQAVLRDAVLGDLVIETGDFDFAETAAIVQALDLVIMTDSAVAHIAGSLGAPVWNLLDFMPHWFFGGDGERSPWYPSMRLFRQQQPGNWQGVMSDVDEALRALCQERVTKPR